MKKVFKSMLALSIVAGFAFSLFNCTEPTSDLSVTFSANKAIYRVGDTITFVINAQTTNDKITAVTLEEGSNDVTIPAVTDAGLYSQTVNYVASGTGEFTFNLTVSSENNTLPIIKTVTVNVVTNTTIVLGASSAPEPSFVNGTTLKTYNSSAAFANQDSVDLVYTFSTTYGPILGAPADSSFTLATWTTKHTTKIARITEESLDAVSGVTGTSVKSLNVGDLLGYITDSGTKGIIKVDNIITGATGKATVVFSVIK